MLALLTLMIFLTPAWSSELLRFQVYLDEKPIGEHRFSIAGDADSQRVSSQARFDIDFLFINAYRYRHSSHEVFRNGCLKEIRATTDDNGEQYRVTGRSSGAGFRIDHQGGSERTDGCLMTFAYWNRDVLDQRQLLNSQTGELEQVRVSDQGRETIEIDGREVEANRYALTTDELVIDLWYNDSLGWVGLSSDAGKGRRINYRRM